MKLSRRILINGLTALLLLGVISGLYPSLPAAAQVENPPARVDREVLESLQGGKSADFIIVMAEQADLSSAYGIADWDERGWYVYNTLKETAARTQKRSAAELKRRGMRFESFFAGNEIYVYGGNEQALNAILALGDAGQVRAPVTVQLEPAARYSQPLGPKPLKTDVQAELQSTVSWGLTDTGATEFWNSYGRQGEGIIVANIDSGVQYNHPALTAAYRCMGDSLPSANCWYDATNPSKTIPYDDNGHGTHTMGTMVGSNNPSLSYTVGMAPGAKWIACKAFTSNGSGSSSALNGCADWILAPGGNPSNRPHIVNNSWGDDVHDLWYQNWVRAWAADGIFPVFSAGNAGSPTTCSTIYSPGDYPESFTVAAHDSTRNIASFSSKGPLTDYYNQPPYLKPNISAPGVWVISAYPTTKGATWAAMDGTSMSAPHVSGAVALLWSCNPALVGQVDQTRDILQASADPSSGGSCPNPPEIDGDSTYGHGYLNVYNTGVGRCIDWIETYLPLINNKYNPGIPPDPILNGNFESGRVAWTEYSKNDFYIITNPNEEPNLIIHNGYWAAWLGGVNNEIAYISQTVGVPFGRSILHYWLFSSSNDTCGNDTFTIKVNEGVFYSESVCTSSATGQWVERTADLSSYAGTTISIKFYMSTNASGLSNVFLDGVSLESSAAISNLSSSTSTTTDPGLAKSNPQP